MILNYLKPKLKLLSIILLLGIMVNSCGSDEEIASVCIYDNASVISEPSKKDGKFISNISLGEKVFFLGENEVDENNKNKKYIFIKMVDGKEGWIQTEFVAINAKPAVIFEKTEIFARPDLSAISKKTYEPMDIIAIASKKDDWLETIGKRAAVKGWIKDKGYSESNVDIATALQIKRALAKSKQSERLADLLTVSKNTNLYGSSLFQEIIFQEIIKIDPNAFPDHEHGEEFIEEIADTTKASTPE